MTTATSTHRNNSIRDKLNDSDNLTKLVQIHLFPRFRIFTVQVTEIISLLFSTSAGNTQSYSFQPITERGASAFTFAA